MKTKLIIFFVFFSVPVFCQINSGTVAPGPYPPISISAEDSLFLCLIPPLEIPEIYSGANAPVLPGSLDNSSQPFFRDVFQQEHYSCGQAALVGYAYTYEINRLRNLPSDIDENRYPTHFSWNWLNNGGLWGGGSYYQTFQLLRKVGTPSVEVYGGMATGGATRWMTGYDNYYQAMGNRIYNSYAINTATEEGITYLKHWLHDHMEESDVGGLGAFYASHPRLHNLPSGTPHEGKKVAIEFISSSHAMTIVGYNDSICWDYNGDGQYTNDIDITGDRIVDVRDWEKGGFIMVNSYGGVPSWGDGGFCYMMYRSLAMPFGNGGIWNNTVNVLDVKESCNPLLTYKVTVSHSSRQKVRIAAGVSSDPTATEPMYEMTFPIVDYQGGDLYMQGGTTEEDKSLELGLDVSELLNYIEPGEPARFFFSVYEDDPQSSDIGRIVSFSLMDYTSGVNEIDSGVDSLLITNNSKTTVHCNATISFNDVKITNTDLPTIDITLPFSDSLEASGGEAPYRWAKYFPYSYESTAETLPMIDEEQLSVTNSNSGYATKTLDFDFSFYDKSYNKVYISADGFLFFDIQNYPWPYVHDQKMILRGYRKIAPFDANLTVSGGGIWYEGNSEYAIFRWESNSGASDLLTDYNFGVKLYPNGDIEFLYGDNMQGSTLEWYSGISDGDYINYEIIHAFDEDNVPANEGVSIDAPQFIPQLNVTKNGVVHGIIDEYLEGCNLNVAVTDKNNLRDVKSFPVELQGILATTIAVAGNDSIIEFDESVSLDLKLHNLSDFAYHQAQIIIHCDDPYITLTDSIEDIGTLAPENITVIEDAFNFDVDIQIPNNHEIVFYGEITSDHDPYPVTFKHTIYAPEIYVKYAFFDSHDGNIYPGDTAIINVVVANDGGADINNINGQFSGSDPYVNINPVMDSFPFLDKYSHDTLLYEYVVRETAIPGHLNLSLLEINCMEGITTNDTVCVNVGGVLEGFESGNFSFLPWQFGGDNDWETKTSIVYQGDWSAKSKDITHNQNAEIYLDINILTGGRTSFYRKVSSETNYDFLKFLVNGNEMGAWSGEQEWDNSSYYLTKGQQTLRWIYKKDYSVDGGLDCGWIDNISLPAFIILDNSVHGGGNFMICEDDNAQLQGSAVNCFSVEWTTLGDGTFSAPNDVETLYSPGPEDIVSQGTILTLTSTPAFGSTISHDISLGIYPNPTVYAGEDTTICVNGFLPLSNATAEWFSDVFWTTDGDGYFDDPENLNPFYYPGEQDYASEGVILSITVAGNPECNASVSDNITLSFNPLPDVFAGENISVPFGTYIDLEGSASGGSGEYSWYWTPEDMFIDYQVQNPKTISLEESFIATLTVLDEITGCIGSDEVVITVTGGQLYVTATAAPKTLCIGEEVQLMALPGGGSGLYSYQWTSMPVGFESDLPAPTVIPLANTTYYVEISDGFNTANDEVPVSVNPLPQPDLGEDQVVCIYNSIILDAGDFDSYLWSTGDTTQTIMVDSTGIGMSSAEFRVRVANEFGCMNNDTIMITFDPCTGIEQIDKSQLTVFPVPAKNKLFLHTTGLGNTLEYIVCGIDGAQVLNGEVSSEQPLNIKSLTPGCYILKVNDGTHSRVAKFIILK